MIALALLVLLIHPRRLLGQLSPARLIRSCLALICVGLALAFGALAFLTNVPASF
jgi:hypothetical protein